MGGVFTRPAIKSAISDREMEVMREVARDKVVLEAGALLGFSTIVLASTALRVISVDPHEGYPVPTAPSTLNKYMHNLEKYGVRDKVIPVIGRVQDLPDILPEVAFFDLDGEYQNTWEALRIVSARTYMVHDFDRQNCSGCSQAVLDFVEKYRLKLNTTDTLAVLG